MRHYVACDERQCASFCSQLNVECGEAARIAAAMIGKITLRKKNSKLYK